MSAHQNPSYRYHFWPDTYAALAEVNKRKPVALPEIEKFVRDNDID